MAPQQYTVEQVLLAAGEPVDHKNITYGSWMNKAVVVFLYEEQLVHLLVERSISSPLFVPSMWITVSDVHKLSIENN